MGITTQTGDAGTTGLLYNRRVSKTDPRIEACGVLDHLSAALGLARAASPDAALRERLGSVQRQLMRLMSELATASEDRERFRADGLPQATAATRAPLEEWIAAVEPEIALKDWAIPGANLSAAGLDLARAVCRQAERQVCRLLETGLADNPEIQIYLNRLSDLLWLLARRAESLPAA